MVNRFARTADPTLLILTRRPNLIVSTGFAVLTAATVPYSYLYFAATTDELLTTSQPYIGFGISGCQCQGFRERQAGSSKESVANHFHEVAAPMLD